MEIGTAMTHTIACREVGGDCEFVATGVTPTEVKRAFWGHLLRDHGHLTASLTPGMRVELERRMDGILDGHLR
jgi:predicted small metal-binding protein